MQQVLAEGGLLGPANFHISQKYCFSGVWNDREARFEHCFLPVISAVPAIVATVLLLVQVLHLAIRYRPKWTFPFVYEPLQRISEGESQRRRPTFFAFALALVAIIGIALQIPWVVRTRCSAESVFPATSWFVTTGMVVVHRSRTAPFSVLVIFMLQGTTDIIRLIDLRSHANLASDNDPFIVASIALAVTGIVLILIMPLRHPDRPPIDVSKPMSHPTSALRSPEDNLTLWQFMTVSWMAPLIGLGYKRQLEDDDVWQLAYEFQHQRLHENFRLLKGTVVQRLIRANIIDIIILTFLGLLELVLQYSTPLLLQRLLSSMEDAAAPKESALKYAAVSFAVRVFAAQSGVFSLWYGRRCYERSRGEMITMLYEKTLNRKVGFAPTPDETKSTSADNANGHANGHVNGSPVGDGTSNKKDDTWWQKSWSRVVGLFNKTKAAPPVKEPASMGKILNLMRNDVYEVAQRFWEIQALVQKPLSVVFSVTLVVRLLGWSSLLAVLVIIIAQCLNGAFAKIMIHFEKKRRLATDKKLQVTSQWIEAIRHLRWYGWQDKWLARIMEHRQKELNLRIITSIWNMVIAFTNSLALDLSPVAAFFAYTVIAGKPLRIDVAFPALQLFQMMTSSLKDLPNLIITLINAWVAVGRIEDYMAEPDRGEQQIAASEVPGISIVDGKFAWPGSQTEVLSADLSFSMGFNVVCGEVASGKTALLQAILGEMEVLDGVVSRRAAPIAYCAQTPWLQSMSIRENILFGEPWDQERYASVLDICALNEDLKHFSNSDSSLIGENGIGLSGGQRARVALARAVYSRAEIMLLDDPLAALDQQTAEHIVEKFIKYRKIFAHRVVILVTHRTDLVLQHATQIVRIRHGKTEVAEKEDYLGKGSDTTTHAAHTEDTGEADTANAAPVNEATVPSEKFIEDEYRAKGGVKLAVYWEYIKAGKLLFWAILIPLLALYRGIAVGESWFLKSWGEAYDHKSSSTLLIHTADAITTKATFWDNLPPPDVDIKPWLVGFLLIAIALSSTFVLSQIMMIIIVYTAGKNMFKEIMKSVAGATFRFYDVTPVGRLMNRMTSDIGVIDGNISQQFQAVSWLLISWFSSMIVIGSVTPLFLAFALALTVAFVAIFLRFIPTSQSLRRLEMVSLTPLMSNFGTLLDGLITVRAFRVQRQFQNRVVRVVDTFQKMDHFYWSLQAWLMYRYDLLAACSTFVLTALALRTNVSAGLTAFVLIAANKLVSSTHGLCKQYGQLQMEFVSVERVVELLHLEQEPKGSVNPPAWWPRRLANIEFDGVTIRYAPHMKPALDDLSVTIRGDRKTVLLGRTGSGKSTMALSLLGVIIPESGAITIDGYNLDDINKHSLRTRITFLAQEPVLFPGSMRDNLDPLDEFGDEQCEEALKIACRDQNFSLTTNIEAGGKNLSQGQRQLIGLSRAILRKSPIVIMDEATASIDRETAATIQRVMNEKLNTSTVLMISHRLEAMEQADFGIVISEGKLVKMDTAQNMLRQSNFDGIEAVYSREEELRMTHIT